MDFLEPAQVIRIMLIFVRISALFVAAPIFSHRSMPVQVRVFLAVLLAFGINGLVPSTTPAMAAELPGLVLLALQEALIGFVLGFTAQFVFWGVQFAGELMGFQMGLRLAQVFDPSNGFNSNPLGRFLMMSLTLLFLVLDGHHLVIEALVRSFQLVPPGTVAFAGIGPPLVDYAGEIFRLALRIATPFMFTIYLIDVALGLFVRAVPQADIFAIALPLKLIVGLLVALLFAQVFVGLVPSMIDNMFQHLVEMIEIMAPA